MRDYDDDHGFTMVDEPIWEQRLGFDAEGYEHREICDAVAVCPVCGEDVELVAETDCWEKVDPPPRLAGARDLWRHAGYGPSTGQHCGKLIADWWEGCFVFDLSSP